MPWSGGGTLFLCSDLEIRFLDQGLFTLSSSPKTTP
jgi:hypothetical protein